MEHDNNRKQAKIVAIIDVILTSFTLWIPVVLLSTALGTSVILSEENASSIADITVDSAEENDERVKIQEVKTVGGNEVILWFGFIVSLVMVVIQLCAAIKLLNATQIGKEPDTAARNARTWVHCALVFTVFMIIGMLRSFSYQSGFRLIFNAITLTIRFSSIFVVYKFIQSSEEIAATSSLCPLSSP